MVILIVEKWKGAKLVTFLAINGYFYGSKQLNLWFKNGSIFGLKIVIFLAKNSKIHG